jgi:hypothetical protein
MKCCRLPLLLKSGMQSMSTSHILRHKTEWAYFSHDSCVISRFSYIQVFQRRLPPEAVDLVSRFLQYSPNLRCTAVRPHALLLSRHYVRWFLVQFHSSNWWAILQLEACMHPFFDELRDPNTRLPNGRPLPPLFNFRSQGSVVVLKQQCCFLSVVNLLFPWHGHTSEVNLAASDSVLS